MRVEKFEDLVVWQKARTWCSEIYRLTREGAFARDFGLRDQIRRAAVSVMSNIAEGFERGKRPEFHQFVCVAKGSCAEVRSQLVIALDCGYLNQDDYDRLMALGQEIARLLGALRKSLDTSR
jgi:four helix bundle protein